MDFFDPEKQKKHARRLMVGYVLIGLLLVMATTILLHQVNGYGVDEKGRIIQNGLVFVSSQPRGADIYLNGEKYKDTTNSRLTLPSGQYLMELRREGYRTWKRIMTVEGAGLERFDYPLLFPAALTTQGVRTHQEPPALATTSPDGRWLLVGTRGQDGFELYDLRDREPVPRQLDIADDILAAASTTTGWQAVEWSKNDRHVILKRTYESRGQTRSEYILFDREEPAASQNLTVAFGFNPTKIEMRDKAHDRYYLFDRSSAQLFTASLEAPTPQPHISGVLDFGSEKNTVAYITAEGAPKGKALVRIKNDAEPPLLVRQVPAADSYVIDLAVYDDRLFLAAGAGRDDRVFLFDDPIGKLTNNPRDPLVPVQILKVDKPQQVLFAPNGRFVAAQNGTHFAVYDAETDRGYVYQTEPPMDKPQVTAAWADGFHLMYVSQKKVVIFDVDGTNLQTLSPAHPAYLPALDTSRRYLYTINPNNTLTRTALLTPEDL